MELGGQFLGEFKSVYAGNRVASEHGEIHVAFRTSGSLRLRAKTIQGNEAGY